VSREIEASPLVLITSPDPYKLQALLDREVRRRAMVVETPVRRVAVGLWAAQVIQLRPLERRWVRPAVAIGGCTTILGSAVLAGWWLLGAFVDAVASAAAVSGATILGVLAVLALVGALLRRSGCETTVIVRHRHR